MADRSPRSAGGPTLADPVPAPLVEAAPAGTAAPAALPFAQRRLRVAIDARKLRDPESGVGSYIVNLVQALLRRSTAVVRLRRYLLRWAHLRCQRYNLLCCGW